MEKTHKIDVVSIRLVEEPPLYSSKELKNPCDVAELFQDFLKDCDREMFCNFKPSDKRTGNQSQCSGCRDSEQCIDTPEGSV